MQEMQNAAEMQNVMHFVKPDPFRDHHCAVPSHNPRSLFPGVFSASPSITGHYARPACPHSREQIAPLRARERRATPPLAA
jgi:hypothetical protein